MIFAFVLGLVLVECLDCVLLSYKFFWCATGQDLSTVNWKIEGGPACKFIVLICLLVDKEAAVG